MQPYQVHWLSRPDSRSPAVEFLLAQVETAPGVLPNGKENPLLGRAAAKGEGKGGGHTQQVTSALTTPFTGGP